MHTKTVLITGATGLVGSYLVRVFLENSYRVYALARGNAKETPEQRVISVLNFWDETTLNKKSDNLYILEGDITKEKLGLDESIIDLLKKEVDEVLHCAALTKLNSSLNDLRKVNVTGTENILKLCVSWNNNAKLKKISYISTIFIYGDYSGAFDENNGDVGQKFNTFYEQSKFEAEKLVEQYRNRGLWIDIFRPCAVIGESITGKIPSFNYALQQLIYIWSKGLLDYFPAGYSLKACFIDELCQSIFHISSKSIEKNKTYHPFGPDLLSLEKLLNLSVEFFGFKKLNVVSREKFIKKSTPSQALLLKHNIFFINTNVKIFSKTTNRILLSYNFNFSKFTKPLMLNILSYPITKSFMMTPNDDKKNKEV